MSHFLKVGFFAATLTVAGAAHAEPSFGFGVTYMFGGDVAAGVRVFHDDKPERGVLALGLDYKFKSGSFRPTVGVAYLDEDYYLDLSLGYDLGTQALDYGFGVGAAFETDAPTISAPAPAPPVNAAAFE